MPIDYRFSGGSYIGASPIIQVDAVVPAYASDASKMRLGSTSIGVDFGTSNYGEAEFRYIKFTGAVVAGDVVLSDASGKRGVQAASGAVATGRGIVGIAMASHPNAATTNDFGFILIRGVHSFANVATLGAGQLHVTMYLTAVAGRLGTAVVATYKADGITARTDTFTAGPTEGNIIELNWPVVSGNG